MAAASAFSYAQAAKGQGAPPSNTAKEQDSQVQSSESNPVTNGQPTSESTEAASAPETRLPAAEKTEQDSTPVQENGNVATESTRNSSRAESRREEDLSRLDRPWRRADKGPTRSSSTTTRSVDDSEHRRPRKGRKSKAADKTNGDDAAGAEKKKPEPEPQPKIELSEAPIPTVNIWQQRRETLSTKPKPTTTSASDSKINGATPHTEKSEPAVKPVTESTEPAAREATPTNGTKATRKTTDSSRTERNASRGSRVADKVSKTEVPPPVGDAVAWPTPETAVKDGKKASETADKSEKEVQDDGSQKPKSKDKWVTYDYVPTVTFETQIQRPSGGKPRGGGRAGSSRGGHSASQVTEKPGASASAPAKPVAEAKESSRQQPNGVPRNSSVPPASKQPAADTAQVNKDSKKPVTQAPIEKKETPTQTTEAPLQREARSERGRGGYRGRGAHHNVSSHGQSHGGQSMSGPNFAPNGMGPRGQPYSPPPRQGPHGQMFAPPPQRGGRGGRNAGGNHYNRMSLPNNASRPPPVQTQFASYEYPMAPMTAMPYQPPPYWDNMVMTMLKQQIEYYFSIDNLCKDMFLRQRMDSQGFVPLHFILAFQRIRDMQAELAMVRAVCEDSNEIDYVVGEDDCERLRRRHGWDTFILPMEDRDAGARNHGPMHPSFKSRSYMGSPFNGMGSPPMHFLMGSSHGYGAPPEQAFQQWSNGAMPAPHGHDQMNGKGINSNGATQLSANVPDFSPSGAFTPGDKNGVASDEDAHAVKADASATTTGNAQGGLTNGVNGVHHVEQGHEASQA